MRGKQSVSNSPNSCMITVANETASSSTSCKLPPSSKFDAMNDESLSRDRAVKFERSVRINVAEVYVHFIPHLNDLSLEDRRLLWITSEESAHLKARNKLVVRQMDSALDDYSNHYCQTDGDDTVCYRGLEHKTIHGSKAHKLARKNAATAVFLEQSRQSKQKNRDVERLREEYRACSAACEESAYQTGLRDAIAALAANDTPFAMGTPKIALETKAEYTLDKRARRSSLTSGKDWTLTTTKATVPFSRKSSKIFGRVLKFVGSGHNDTAR